MSKKGLSHRNPKSRGLPERLEWGLKTAALQLTQLLQGGVEDRAGRRDSCRIDFVLEGGPVEALHLSFLVAVENQAAVQGVQATVRFQLLEIGDATIHRASRQTLGAMPGHEDETIIQDGVGTTHRDLVRGPAGQECVQMLLDVLPVPFAEGSGETEDPELSIVGQIAKTLETHLTFSGGGFLSLRP